MIQKQLEQLIREVLRFCFYWDEYIINQVFLSALLVLLVCRLWIVNHADNIARRVSAIKDNFPTRKEIYDGPLVLSIFSGRRHS